MNIIQQQEALKDLSDNQIASEMQHPSGQMPLYLISTEAKRRADLRERHKVEASGPPPASTVQEDLLRSIMSSQTAPTGIAQGISQPPPTQAAQSAPQMPPQMPPQQQGIMQGAPSMPPQGLPGNTGAPRGFAMGGAVRTSPFESLNNRTFLQDYVFNRRGEADARILERQQAADLQNAKNPAVTGDPFSPINPHQREYAEDPYVPQGRTRDYDSAPITPSHNGERSTDYTLADFGGVPQPFLQQPLADHPAVNSGIGALNKQFEALGNVPQRRAVGAPTLGSGSYSALKDAALKKVSGGPDPYADIASKLGERETGLDNASDKNMWLSLAKGGFDAAAGTSQYALSNIAQGGIGGLDAYNTGETAIQGRRDKLLDSQTNLIDKQQDLKFKFQSIADAEAKGELSSIDAENARKIAMYGIQNDVEGTRYANDAALRADKIKLLDMKSRESISEKANLSREAVAKMPPALIQSYEYAMAMPEGTSEEIKSKERLMGMLDGSSKRGATAMIKSSSDFNKMYQKYVTDNGAVDAEGWKLLKTAFAADPNAQLFEFFAAGVRGNTGQKPNLADQWEIKDGVRVRKQT